MTRFVLVLCISLISYGALASKARLVALSQDENGSIYVQDTRSIFLNPAQLAKLGDFANFEMGSSNNPTTAGTPNAEGGYFRALGSMKAGFQLGRESHASTNITAANSATGFSLLSPQNTVEIFVAGDAPSLGWGFSALYGTAEDNAEKPTGVTSAYPNKKANTFEVRGGVVGDVFEFYGHLDLISTSDNEAAASSTQKFTSRPSLRLGGAFNLMEDLKLYGDLNWKSWNAKNDGANVDMDGDTLALLVGIVQYVNVDKETRFFYTPALEINNYKVKDNKGGSESKSERIRIPLTVGLESDVSEWLTLRTSVTQKVLIDQNKTTVTDNHNPNSTSVGAGAGVRWKKLTLDGTLAGSTSGDINGNSLLANAAVTYKF